MPDLVAFLDAIPLPALLVRRDERIEASNEGAKDLFGTGIDGRHFITALRQPALLDAVEACLRTAEPRTATYLTSADGRDVTYSVTVRPAPVAGKVMALVAFQDVSELQYAGQMRRDFVANVSHELRTPLTALIGFIETLRGPAREDPAGRDRFLSIMEREAHRMNRLVSDLLSLSRVEQDERVRPTDPVDLSTLIPSALHSLAPVAEAAQVTLHPVLPDGPVVVPADADQLRQLVSNLVVNAINYGGAGTQVTVRVTPSTYRPRLRGPGPSLTVEDTGPGIDLLDIPRLTERFYRVDDHRSREMGGTGLGLAIVKHIVNRHRGRLLIESTLGQGTTVSVLLPDA